MSPPPDPGATNGDVSSVSPPLDSAMVARPQRRVRYSGKNPRSFAQKYKEHDPARYSEDVSRIMARGKTPAGMHRPILVAEILEVLSPVSGETFVDATLGYGGHSTELLQRLAPDGRLLGLDVDPLEQPKTEERLRSLGYGPELFHVRLGNFAGLAATLMKMGWGPVDGILADLGVSSMQIDDPARGFTFKADGPLDLRLNPQRGLSAAEWLARVTPEKLSRALAENADEPHASLLAQGLVQARTIRPWTRTVQLAEGIRSLVATQPGLRERAAADNVVRRVFQALRIEVNDEFSALDAFLRGLPASLKPGGRVAVLTFHSGEDRRVKQAFKAGRRDGVWSAIAEDVIRPSPEEQRSNPRSASAKLRWAIRA